jgi:hypothetical protein
MLVLEKRMFKKVGITAVFIIRAADALIRASGYSIIGRDLNSMRRVFTIYG